MAPISDLMTYKCINGEKNMSSNYKNSLQEMNQKEGLLSLKIPKVKEINYFKKREVVDNSLERIPITKM